MVKLMIGRAGSGKTKKMVEVANQSVEAANGNIVFISKDNKLMYDLKYFIRFICLVFVMETRMESGTLQELNQSFLI